MSNPLRKSELGDGRVAVRIGLCRGRSEASDHVEALLAKAGIQAIIHGSRAYAIEVVESDASRAAELLRADPERDYYGITVYDA